MEFTIKHKEGDYRILGARLLHQKVVFTFVANPEDECSIILKHFPTGEVLRQTVPEEYSCGSLRSVALEFIPDVQISPVKSLVPEFGYRYEINGKTLLDPFAKRLTGREVWMDSDRSEVFCSLDLARFADLPRDKSPEIAKEDMVLYKLHVRGYTMDKGCTKKYAGTFAGLSQKISYLKDLGITSVEVMPIYEFDKVLDPGNRTNYWGYGQGNYFAVKSAYAFKKDNAEGELRELISQFHRNNMEFIMEIFFTPDTPEHLVMDVLHFWKLQYQIDGFHLIGDSLPLRQIVADPLLSRTKILCADIPENLRQIRKNDTLYVDCDEYLYPARKILNHINPDMTEFMNQQRKQSTSCGYINYISSNNGFSMADLFRYNDRHNEANGEKNADGADWNFSNNQGIEGPSNIPLVEEARRRNWKNAVSMLSFAQSVPMLWSGDEFENSQQGNNNAYCQDNEIGWVNWKKNRRTAEDIEFVTGLLAFRRKHKLISNPKPFTFSDYKSFGAPDLSMHGEFAWMNEDQPGSLAIGVMYHGAYDKACDESVYIAYNFYAQDKSLALPTLTGSRQWYLIYNTTEENADPMSDGTPVSQRSIEVPPMSISVLVGR